jgi:hypothetical protein
MAKSARKAPATVLTMPGPASPTPAPSSAAAPSNTDIALRAFELYCARGCQPGHDVEDWLQAERELHEAPTIPPVRNRRAPSRRSRPTLRAITESTRASA